MRERPFVEQNKENWRRFEILSEGDADADPEELSDLYSQLSSDLSFARTFFNQRSIRVYLNYLARSAYLRIYGTNRSSRGGFLKFWSQGLPEALYLCRRELLLSLLVFALAVGIGVLSSAQDPAFPELILGSDYVQMTEENIARGEPMAVYGTAPETGMFLSITINNLLVAFRTYVLGAFLGVGTLVILLFNGIMVGSFQHFFIARDLFRESFLSIWMHGALEISAIIVAGGAGLALGKGLLFPGSLPRFQAFQLGARRSLKIMLGLVPVFVLAAFIEGFFTRLTDLPDGLRLLFIMCCFVLALLYFWVYPYLLFRASAPPPYQEAELIPLGGEPLVLHMLRKPSEVFTSTFALYASLFRPIIRTALLIALAMGLALLAIYGSELTERVVYKNFSLYNLKQFHSYGTLFWLWPINLLGVSTLVFFVLRHLKKVYHAELQGSSTGWRLFMHIAVIVAIFEGMVLSGNILVAGLAILLIPYLCFWLQTAFIEGLGLAAAFKRSIYLQGGSRRKIVQTYLLLLVLGVLMLFILDSPLTWLYTDVLQWNVEADDQTKAVVAVLSMYCLNVCGVLTLLPLFVLAQCIEYFSAREAMEAGELERSVALISRRRSAYGMYRE